jgi:Protein of unknown function (DUF2892)
MSALKAAFFVKNVPSAERAVRLLLGAASVAFGVATGGTFGWLVLASGVVFTATGLFGFCPMCALAGRRLASKG